MRFPIFISLPVSLLLLTALSACDKSTTPPTSSSTAQAPVTATAPLGTPGDLEPEVERSDVAIDEPLPPFEDDSGIVLVSRSDWRTADASLVISGEVFLYEAPDGSRLLRLENLQSPKELRINLGLDDTAGATKTVGALKGPSGNMNYLLDSGLKLDSIRAFVLVEHPGGRPLASAALTKP